MIEMMTWVMSMCLMPLFSNLKKEMWSTWSSKKTMVFLMITTIVPLLVDFYFLLCEISCKTPTANCITLQHHNIKNMCANYIQITLLYLCNFVWLHEQGIRIKKSSVSTISNKRYIILRILPCTKPHKSHNIIKVL